MVETRRSAQKASQESETPAAVIELSSDSEPEEPEPEVDDGVEDEVPEPAADIPDVAEQPLLRAAGIKYKIDKPEEEQVPQDKERSSPASKLAVQVRETPSAKHRHVSIEIPLPTSSELRRRKAEAEGIAGQEENDEVFNTPSVGKRITFDDSDYDEFVTPKEAPSRDPMENSIPRSTSKRETADAAGQDDEEDVVEDSDDDAPPEAISTHAAQAETVKAAEAAAKAAEQQAAALKRKRQERDAFFKQQAEERKRAEQQLRRRRDSDDATPSTEEATPETEKRDEAPKLLPLELLESDDEDDVSQQLGSSGHEKRKRRKLGAVEQALLREPKLPKDKKVGSTAYRVVAGTGDSRLAPKVKKQTVNLRETLLRRDRVAKPRGGFFATKR
ncbi:hypothetical protein C8A03DRAFT_42567 [Achaetomium macrosporum]|uniref:Uncharacterized protein n=1 Tax=Achaetomium macrosporum TaxID=79813 RepID=A0AAN7HCL6_9PEZI|nr:hypothetical protein C8A03DRAFT_42567 [Achaetomium macrosporum]